MKKPPAIALWVGLPFVVLATALALSKLSSKETNHTHSKMSPKEGRTSHPLWGSVLPEPKAAPGYQLSRVVTHKELAALASDEVTLSHDGALNENGDLYFFGRVKEMVGESKRFRYPLFKWSAKAGLKLIHERIAFVEPRAMLINPKTFGECQKNDPIVFGLLRVTHSKEKVFGARCLRDNGSSLIVYENDDYRAITNARVNPRTSEVILSFRRPSEQRRNPSIHMLSVDLKTGEEKTLIETLATQMQGQVESSVVFGSDKKIYGVNAQKQVLSCQVAPSDCQVLLPDPIRNLTALTLSARI